MVSHQDSRDFGTSAHFNVIGTSESQSSEHGIVVLEIQIDTTAWLETSVVAFSWPHVRF